MARQQLGSPASRPRDSLGRGEGDTRWALVPKVTVVDMQQKRYSNATSGYERPTSGDRATILDTSFSVAFPASGRSLITVSSFFEVRQGTYALMAYCPADNVSSSVGQVAYAGGTALTFGTTVSMEAMNTPGSTKTYELQHAMTYRAATDGSQYGMLLGDSNQKIYITSTPIQ